MAKKVSVKIGNPEHLIDGDRARQLLNNRIMYMQPGSAGVNQGLIPRDENGKYDAQAFESRYGLDAKRVPDAARELSDSIIRKLEGNEGQFSRFTVESISIMSNDMARALGEADVNQWGSDDIDTAINMLPASNGKTFTTVQMLRTEEFMLDSQDFDKACDHANKATYPKTWLRDDDKVVSPRGVSDVEKFITVADTPFTKLSESQQTAVANIYSSMNKSEALHEIVDVDYSSEHDSRINEGIVDGTNEADKDGLDDGLSSLSETVADVKGIDSSDYVQPPLSENWLDDLSVDDNDLSR